MINENIGRNRLKCIFAYTIAIILCLMILIWVMELWNADLSIPFRYSDDALGVGLGIKGVIDNGWYLHNNYVGMPTGLDMYDFLTADNFHFLLIKIFSLFSSDFAFIMNFYFLLTFPLTTLSSLFVFRQFNLSYASSIVTSLLFTFLPYHFIRGETHLFLAAYYMVPLMVMVILWVFTEKSFLFNYDLNKDKIKFELDFKSILSIIVCLLVVSTGVYYAFFAGLFLLIAGTTFIFLKNNKYKLYKVDILVVIIIAGSILNILPNMVFIFNHGFNSDAIGHSPIGAELYGMKIDQLLMPVDEHRLPYVADFKEWYNENAPLVGENNSSSLGLIGSIGFLILICGLFNRYQRRHAMRLNYSLSILNLSAVLLATIGGFGFLIALMIPGIRSYNRMSIYIAFFSLFAINLLLDNIYRKHLNTKIRKYIYYGFLGFILVVGILDQTNKSFVPSYDFIKSEYTSDRQFINRIEASVPNNAMIFQFPYVPFPEGPQVYKMRDYDLFRGYLHSRNLRWSYGALIGRDGDKWQREVAKKPLNEILEILAVAGFNGIYLDRNGYDDMGADMETRLTNLLDVEPMVSVNSRLVFFDMAGYNKKLKENYTEDKWILKQELAQIPQALD